MSTELFLKRKLLQRSKKGQIQIGVTMIVVFVFILLLLFSLIIYFRFTYSELKETNEELMEQKYSSLLNTFIGLPEFRCSRFGVEEECLDAAKLNEVKDVIDKNKEYYKGIFSNAEAIWVEIINKDIGIESSENSYFGKKEFLIYGNKNGKGLVYTVPVAVYYPDYKIYKIGELKIRGNF